MGWIFAQSNNEREYILSAQEVSEMAAVQHEIGEHAVTGVVSMSADGNVHFEAFQVRTRCLQRRPPCSSRSRRNARHLSPRLSRLCKNLAPFAVAESSVFTGLRSVCEASQGRLVQATTASCWNCIPHRSKGVLCCLLLLIKSVVSWDLPTEKAMRALSYPMQPCQSCYISEYIFLENPLPKHL